MRRADLISSFTPSTMSPETLEAIFVQREPLAQRMTSSVRNAASTGDLEHHLAVGPRGMGKTHLLSLVAHRLLADEKLTGRLAIAWLREEEWGVTSLGELFERVITQLADDDDSDPQLRRRASEALGRLAEEPLDRLTEAAEAELPEVLGDRLLVIVVENLDQIFQDIGGDGQHQLRAFLQNQRNTVLLASTPSLAQSIAVRSGPFFGFFAIHHLDELTIEEARQLLIAIARLRDDDEGARLIAYLGTPEATTRLRVVEHIAGGHPRLWVLMAECITTERLEEVVGLLVAVLDDLTPYYQAQMNVLSSQQRKIVMHLSRAEGAITVKELATAVRIQERVAATQLGLLVKLGYVRKAELPAGFSVRDKRTSAYELREPLLRHVLEVKESRGKPLRLIVELLRAWYDDQKLTDWIENGEPVAATYARAALAQPGGVSTQELTNERRQALAHHRAAAAAYSEGSYTEALAAYDAALELDPRSAATHHNRGMTLHALGRFEDAIAAYDAALELDPTSAVTHHNRGLSLNALGQITNALAAYDAGVELHPDDTAILNSRGNVLLQLERYDEALTTYDTALGLEPNDAAIHSNRGLALHDLERYEEALTAFDTALELDPSQAISMLNRANALYRLKRYRDALNGYDAAIRLDPKSANARFNRALVQTRHGAGELPTTAELKTAIELAPDPEFLDSGLRWMLVAPLERSVPDEAAVALVTGTITEACARSGRTDELVDAATRVLRDEPRARSEAWTGPLLDALMTWGVNGPLVDLLAAIAEYRADGDGAVLLRLPTELRELATEILGDGEGNGG